MKSNFKLTLLMLLLYISCTKTDNEGSNNTALGTRISKITYNPSNPTFISEFQYSQNKLTEVALPLKGTYRKIEYENELATAIRHYVNNELAGTTKLIYENNKLIKTDNGENSDNFLVFSYNENLLSKVEQFLITGSGEFISEFTMEYIYETDNVIKRILTGSSNNKIEYEYSYDNKTHFYKNIPEPIRIYFFWPEGISSNNALSQKTYIDGFFNSEISYEFTYNDLDLPISRKTLDGENTSEFAYE